MESEKELLLEAEEVTTEQEEAKEEEPREPDEPAADEPEEVEPEEGKDGKADPKAEKRINKLTAINKSLQEQLKEAKEALDEAKEALDRKDQVLEAEKKAYMAGFGQPYTAFGGKLLYELTDEEFDAVIDWALEQDEPKTVLAEVRAQRRQGKPLLKRQEEIEAGEQQLWEYEWGIITKAMLDEEIGNPELKKHADKLASEIAPIFLKRKEDKELGILYRQLTEGGVDAKMKHLTRLMKKLNLYTLVDSEVEIPTTTGQGKKAPVTTQEKTFTRAQIAKMSVEEFAKNEAAIDKAMAQGRIK